MLRRDGVCNILVEVSGGLLISRVIVLVKFRWCLFSWDKTYICSSHSIPDSSLWLNFLRSFSRTFCMMDSVEGTL